MTSFCRIVAEDAIDAHRLNRSHPRTLFPITHPILGPRRGEKAVGMCGQGFMLGPGLGSALASVIAGEKNKEDLEILAGFKLERNFSAQEKLK